MGLVLSLGFELAESVQRNSAAGLRCGAQIGERKKS